MNKIKENHLISSSLFLVFLLTLLLSCQRQEQIVFSSDHYKIFANRIEQGKFIAVAKSPSEIHSNYKSPIAIHSASEKSWKLEEDLSSFPQYHSNLMMVEALYNLSLEELIKNTTEEGLFDTSAEWKGVWTRDISYSILLALAITHPEVSKACLLQKVKGGRIQQDTGTGGSWPVSSDRMAWSLAAWEIYKVTGDREWLQMAYQIIKKSTDNDLNVVWDFRNHLFRGESSFLDWREQSYPRWMQPKDIYNSMCLGTQAVHYQSLKILSQMGQLLGYEMDKYEHIAEALRASINNKLWIPERSYYGQYLYGRNHSYISDKSESLGEAFTILFDIASPERQQEVMSNTPVLFYGIPCFYPQIIGIPPYHNDAIWPFVQAYWNWAAAKTGNLKALSLGLASTIRHTGLFLSNKENMVASSGDFEGTALNSDRQLWSVAGTLSSIYRTLFGLNYEVNQLTLAPSIPMGFKGKHIIKNLKYRKATLTIEIHGYGNQIRRIKMDGEKINAPIIPADLEGDHTILIEMDNYQVDNDKINLVNNHFAPETPKIQNVFNNLHWRATKNTEKYRVIRNGIRIAETKTPHFNNIKFGSPAEYQIQGIDSLGYTSFLSEPINIVDPEYQRSIEAEYFAPNSSFKAQNYSGWGFLMLNKNQNRNLNLGARTTQEGYYRIEFRYANGSGPVNTDNKCCIRTLWVNGGFQGTVIFPQRGKDAWDQWGYSNSIKVLMKKGYNRLTLSLEPFNENMDGTINMALLDQIRITRLEH